MPPPVVSLSQINKNKRSFAARVVRAPSKPPASRQTTAVPSENLAGSSGAPHSSVPISQTSVHEDGTTHPSSSAAIHQRATSVHSTIPARRPTMSPEIQRAALPKVSSSAGPSLPISVENHTAPKSIRPPTAPTLISTPISTPTSIPIPNSSARASLSPEIRTAPLVARSPVIKPTSIRPPTAPPAQIVIDPTLISSPIRLPSASSDQAGPSSIPVRPPGVAPETPGGSTSGPLTASVVGIAHSEHDSQSTPSTKKPATRSRRAPKRAANIDTDDGEETHDDDFAAPKPKRAKRTRKAKSTEIIPEDDDEGGGEHGAASTPPAKKKRARRKRATTASGEESAAESGAPTDDDQPAQKKKRRARSSTASTTPKATRTPRKKRKSAEQVALEDAEAEEKEHDPTQTTMSALIEDLPVGRSTSARVEVQARIRANRIRDRARRDALRNADRNITMGKPRNAGQENEQPQAPSENPTAAKNLEHDDFFDQEMEDNGEDDWFNSLTTSTHAPQIGMDYEGNVAPDELRMEVDHPDNHREENYEAVFERDADRFVNSMSHSKKHKGSQRWTQAETANFFHNLAMYGIDFESIARVMPGRTRNEIRNKFNAEDRRNSQLINEYLFKPKPIDLEEAGRMTGKDLSGPPPEVRVRSKKAAGEKAADPAAGADADENADDDEPDADFEFSEDTGQITPAKRGSSAPVSPPSQQGGPADSLAPGPSAPRIAHTTVPRSPSPVHPDDLYANSSRAPAVRV